MNKWMKGIAVLSLLCTTACANTPGYDALPPLTKIVDHYITNADEAYAYDISYTLAYDEKYLSNKLGFRTAGSDAEHAAADYIADEMKKLNLEVEKVPVTVDKWQFNDASLTLDGTDISIMHASYATNGTDEKGIHAQIVDVATGTEADYEGLDVEGKIVLAGVDQWNVAWIDQYLNEAANHGAAAIVTYDIGGYATYSDDMINMQDLCAEDVIPCVSISKNQYLELSAEMQKGNDTALLKVDNEMLADEGTSYNVVGKLAGRNHDQQIIISGHYDVYFNGFQDDSCAIGLVLAIAKGMKDSGYQPENDILFIAHGSEEWGAIGSQFDWTTGAWEMINNANPEWAAKTIAMINFELPAFYDGKQQGQISCVPEYASFVEEFVTSYRPSTSSEAYPEGFSPESIDTNTMEDGVSYRASGVPYFINIPGTQDGEEGWIQQHYHTVSDSSDTYSKEVMSTNITTYSALAIVLDQLPAIYLDFTATCDDLLEAYDGEENDYTKAVTAFHEAAEKHNARITDINNRYLNALKENKPQAELDAIRDEGVTCNKVSLETFKAVQDGLIGIISTSDIVIKHTAYANNITLLEGIISALEKGELGNEEETGALDLAWQLNGSTEFGYYNFSVETNDSSKKTLLEDRNPNNVFWGTDKGSVHAKTYPATISLLEKAESEETDFTSEIAIYKTELESQTQLLNDQITAETNAIQKITSLLTK